MKKVAGFQGNKKARTSHFDEYELMGNWLRDRIKHCTKALKVMWEVMPFYTRCYERRPCFVRGDKPKELAEIARITERQWASYQTHIQRQSPILTGLRYLKVFEQESVTSYAKAAEILGVSRVRVFQLASLVTKLPKEITDYLVQNNDNPDIRRHFTERRLRPLVSLPTQDDQITQFKEMLTDLHPEQPVLTPEQ